MAMQELAGQAAQLGRERAVFISQIAALKDQVTSLQEQLKSTLTTKEELETRDHGGKQTNTYFNSWACMHIAYIFMGGCNTYIHRHICIFGKLKIGNNCMLGSFRNDLALPLVFFFFFSFFFSVNRKTIGFLSLFHLNFPL